MNKYRGLMMNQRTKKIVYALSVCLVLHLPVCLPAEAVETTMTKKEAKSFYKAMGKLDTSLVKLKTKASKEEFAATADALANLITDALLIPQVKKLDAKKNTLATIASIHSGGFVFANKFDEALNEKDFIKRCDLLTEMVKQSTKDNVTRKEFKAFVKYLEGKLEAEIRSPSSKLSSEQVQANSAAFAALLHVLINRAKIKPPLLPLGSAKKGMALIEATLKSLGGRVAAYSLAARLKLMKKELKKVKDDAKEMAIFQDTAENSFYADGDKESMKDLNSFLLLVNKLNKKINAKVLKLYKKLIITILNRLKQQKIEAIKKKKSYKKLIKINEEATKGVLGYRVKMDEAKAAKEYSVKLTLLTDIAENADPLFFENYGKKFKPRVLGALKKVKAAVKQDWLAQPVDDATALVALLLTKKELTKYKSSFEKGIIGVYYSQIKAHDKTVKDIGKALKKIDSINKKFFKKVKKEEKDIKKAEAKKTTEVNKEKAQIEKAKKTKLSKVAKAEKAHETAKKTRTSKIAKAKKAHKDAIKTGDTKVGNAKESKKTSVRKTQDKKIKKKKDAIASVTKAQNKNVDAKFAAIATVKKEQDKKIKKEKDDVPEEVKEQDKKIQDQKDELAALEPQRKKDVAEKLAEIEKLDTERKKILLVLQPAPQYVKDKLKKKTTKKKTTK